MNRLYWRAASAVGLLLAMGACVGDEHPRIRACKGAAGVGEDLSHGRLTVLPSTVDGAEIDSATWLTNSHTFDIGAESMIVLTSRIKAARPLTDGELAVVYHFTGKHAPPPMVDTLIELPIYSSTPAESAAWETEQRGPTRRRTAGETFRAEYRETVQTGMSTSRWLPFAGCPATAQLVRRVEAAAAGDSTHIWAGLQPTVGGTTGEAGGGR